MEATKESKEAGEKVVGLTMAVTAACLALATLMGHRLHTEEVVMQTRSADGWAYYQAKNNRSHMYENDAKLAELTGAAGAGAVVADWNKKATEERTQADEIQHQNQEMDRETEATARRATFFDLSEISLEVAIVMSSIALLTRAALFWRLSFLPAAFGVILGIVGFLR